MSKYLSPFFLALVVGFGVVWLFRNYQKNKVLNSVTYRDESGAEIFAGPDVDPVTGNYTGPGDRIGTLGNTQAQNN